VPHYRLGDFAKIVNRSGFAGSASVLDFTEFNDRSGETIGEQLSMPSMAARASAGLQACVR
jgi:hypothetical protein